MAGMKRFVRWAFPVLLMLFYPWWFYTDVLSYHAHADGAAIAAFILGLPSVIICVVVIIRAVRRREWGVVILYGLAAATCVFFWYWIRRIPFCTMCYPMKKKDLGFMLEPFADRFGDFWLD